MKAYVSRRDFLKLSSLSLGSLAFNRFEKVDSKTPKDAIGYIRVSVREVRIYSDPSYASEVIRIQNRDQLLYVFEKFDSPEGPSFNPTWYQLDDGFIHSAYTQPVETKLNAVVSQIRPEGQVFEVAVPLTQSYRNTKTYGWQKLYRLYYRSNHWVTGIEEGPDGALWYKLTDELLLVDYFVLATHMRPIADSEIRPLSTHVAPENKRVEVSIAEQRMWAYEENELIFDTKISTGIPNMATNNGVPTATPRGVFHVSSKMPVRHMGNGRLTSDIEAYELPGVPWVSYFHETGVAFHGTYWHDNYGNEMSHGCVNMTPDDSKWLFRWLTPESDPKVVNTNGYGTRISVF